MHPLHKEVRLNNSTLYITMFATLLGPEWTGIKMQHTTVRTTADCWSDDIYLNVQSQLLQTLVSRQPSFKLLQLKAILSTLKYERIRCSKCLTHSLQSTQCVKDNRTGREQHADWHDHKFYSWKVAISWVHKMHIQLELMTRQCASPYKGYAALSHNHTRM